MNPGFYEQFPVLETTRLRLRAMTVADDELIFALFSDPEVTRFYDVATMTDQAQATALADRLRRRFPDRIGIRWVIEVGGRAIGTCGYQGIVAASCRASLGYELVRDAWGHGYATEAVAAVVEHGHRAMGLHRIDALVYSANHASGAVLRKCGFLPEGVLADYGRLGDQFADMTIYAHVDR
ncbi:MAG TPA: GNAT family N-acetyltransferase [Kofleriaceae bacterium]